MSANPHSKIGWLLAARRFRHRLKLTLARWLLPDRHYVPLFVLATGRSGSTLLIDYLRSLSGVNCYSEVLAQDARIGLRREERTPEASLRHIRRSLQSLRTPIRCCKFMLYQLEECGLTMDDLRRAFPDAKYLIIYRESLVEQYLSRCSASVSGQWLVRRGKTPKQPQVTVDPLELHTYCEETRQQYEGLLTHAWLREHSVLLSYEDLVADPRRWFFDHICPLLNLPGGEPQTRLVKQNSRSVADRVENYHAIAEALNNPSYRQRYASPDSANAAPRAA
jgi:LPS sulfotransferase NodH